MTQECWCWISRVRRLQKWSVAAVAKPHYCAKADSSSICQYSRQLELCEVVFENATHSFHILTLTTSGSTLHTKIEPSIAFGTIPGIAQYCMVR